MLNFKNSKMPAMTGKLTKDILKTLENPVFAGILNISAFLIYDCK